MANVILEDAISAREDEYVQVIDQLRDNDKIDGNEAHLLREALELAGCCRRLLRGRTVKEVHDAFGAPGDFGYDTPIGDALSKLYRAGQ